VIAAVAAVMIVAVAAAGALLRTGNTATAARVQVAHMQTRIGVPLDVWAQSDGSIEFAAAGTDSLLTLKGNGFKLASSDGDMRIERYATQGALWHRMNLLFAVTRAQVMSAIRSAPRAPLPAVAAKIATVKPTHFQSYTHYGTNVKALAAAIHAPVVSAPTLLGLPLAEADSTSQTDPESGTLVDQFLVYSADSSDPGDSSQVITLDDAVSGSAQANLNGTFLNTAAPDFTSSNGNIATETGPSDIVAQVGTDIVAVSASWEPTNAQWQTILDALAPVPPS
jgi:hypothetical protein